MWNPLESLKRKITGQPAPEAGDIAAPDAQKTLQALKEAAKEAGVSSPKDLEQPGMMAKFFRHWKNPALLKQVRGVVSRMQAEGINVRDRKAVEAWLKAHQKELESGEFADAPAVAKPQTFVKTGPEIGRNDPCTCGSGKKYKKCCGAK